MPSGVRRYGLAMNKPDDNVFRDMRRWVQDHGWWFNTVVVILTLFIVLNTSEQRNWDSIGLTLTTLEIFLVLGAFSGFWLIRREAIAQARETAEEVAKQTATELYQKRELSGEGISAPAVPEPPSIDDRVREGDDL